jgi:superfamily II DNA or RNA helicase
VNELNDACPPVEGCWVQTLGEKPRLGIVQRSRQPNGRWEVEVHWGSGEPSWMAVERLACGLQPGWEVQDIPVSQTRTSLGRGRVEAVRRLGSREQVLLQLADTGRSVWLPYENLKRIPSVALRYQRRQVDHPEHAERCRLRMLAHALESWNEVTGALARLDVDPLPHQIHLVHRILSSNHVNWLIADDVGLGKTIEIGLVLNALRQRRSRLRVLIVTPAGLVRQWQDELKHKFDQFFRIYGRDFAIHDVAHWPLEESVIASIDLAKRDDHFRKFRDSGPWDVIVVDEAHKLTRDDHYRAQRFRLVEALRELSDALLLLTATPHQGKTNRFIGLLKLVRPDLSDQLDFIEAQPEIVREIILRNRKATVTDMEGRFIFHGQHIRRVAVPVASEMRTFVALLQDYLRRGYRASTDRGDAGRAIGFVMTVYRKLASSSIAAIIRALELRRSRLLGQSVTPPELSLDELPDLAEGGDDQDDLARMAADAAVTSFFADELRLIDQLLAAAKPTLAHDLKRRCLEAVLDHLVDHGKNVVIFTEYRATQGYLSEILQQRYPSRPPPQLIHGGMSLDEKVTNIEAFNGAGGFLVSTEAGGEGLNLHKNCHVLINYDLPWNPTRLVQRIGRLYRYGQHRPVIAFNFHSTDGFDSKVLDLLYTKVEAIAQALAPVDAGADGRLHAEILGELLEHLDVGAVLERASQASEQRTQDEIEQAISKAQEARALEDQLLSYANGFDPAALKGTLGFTTAHAQCFVEAMLPMLNIGDLQRLHGGRVIEARLPDDLVGRFAEFGRQQIVRLTCDRRAAGQLPQAQLMDFASPFFRYLIDNAKAYAFGGFYGCRTATQTGILAAYRLRWQDDQGNPTLEEFLTVLRDGDEPAVNPPLVVDLLTTAAVALSPPEADALERAKELELLQQHAEKALAQRASRFRHPNDIVFLAATDLRSNLSLRRDSGNGASPHADGPHSQCVANEH